MSESTKPKRIQRKRTKGWKMPPNTLCVTRPGRLGNPFHIGGWFALDVMGMSYCEATEGFQDERFTLIETPEQSIALFREYRQKYRLAPAELKKVREADYIACWCPLDQPCHADVLLEIANA
jgi:hypothetical protein